MADIIESGAGAGLTSAANSTPLVQQLLQVLSQKPGMGNTPLMSMQPAQNPELRARMAAQAGTAPPHFQPSPIKKAPAGGYASSGENKRASRQALLSGIASTVRDAGNYINQKRDRDMGITMTRTFEALDGLAQAQASGDQDSVKKNQELLSHTFDPTTPEGKKNIKMYEKVLGVNIVGESKDKDSPEYKTFIKSLQDWTKQGKQAGANPVVQNIQKQTPSTQQLTPEMQAQAAAVQAKVAPSADKQIEQQTEAMRSVTELSKNKDSIEGREKVAQMIVDAKTQQQKATLALQLKKDFNALERTTLMTRATIKRAEIAAASGVTRSKWNAMARVISTNAKADSTNKTFKMLHDSVGMQEKAIDDALKGMKNAQSELDKNSAGLTKLDDKDVMKYAQQVTMYQAQFDSAMGSREKYNRIAQSYVDAGILKDTDDGSNSGSVDESESRSSGEATDGLDLDKFFTDSENQD